MKNKLIKFGSLIALSTTIFFSSFNVVSASDRIKINESVQVYMDAYNAQRGTNAVTSFRAGDYHVFRRYNGMVNITRKPGVAGGWINPNNLSTTTPTNQTSSNTYSLQSQTRGYMNADNAKLQRNHVTTLSPGEYSIFRRYNGMINLTRKSGVPGAWINPNVAVSQPNTNEDNTITNRPVANTYTLTNDVSGYMNANLARLDNGSSNTVRAGQYYVFREYNGMLNVTSRPGVPGSWINPNSTTVVNNQPTQTPSTPSTPQATTPNSPKLYSLNYLQYHGVINWGGYRFTYYSQQVLPGGGLRIPGRHVNADGYVADGDGYIVLANDAPRGTIINTPFGYQGKVYDRGTYGNHFDVYTR